MSKASQIRFLEKLIDEVSSSKVKEFRRAYADKQESNLFINRRTLRKGFRLYLLKEGMKKSDINSILNSIDKDIYKFIIAVGKECTRLNNKKSNKYLINIENQTRSSLHVRFDQRNGKNVYDKVFSTYNKEINILVSNFGRVVSNSGLKGGEVFNLSHAEFEGIIESAVKDALDKAVQEASGGITLAKARKFLQDRNIDMQVIRNTKTDVMNYSVASKVENLEDKDASKARLKTLRKELQKALQEITDTGKRLQDLPGSDSFTEIKRKRAIQELEKAYKRAIGLNVIFEDSKIKENVTKHRKKKKLNSNISAVNIKRTGGGTAAASRKKGVASQPLQLIGIMNKRLPDTVRKNMNAPALQNVTGRFAESVKITEIQKTPQGHPSFGYTYQKSPYQRFEMGRGDPPWATPERDPRKLIERSIREIAAQFALGRFYTRRV